MKENKKKNTQKNLIQKKKGLRKKKKIWQEISEKITKLSKFSKLSGFVKISANCWSVSTNSKDSFFLFTWSCKKWCLKSICLVLPYWIEILEILIALVLSRQIGIRVLIKKLKFKIPY